MAKRTAHTLTGLLVIALLSACDSQPEVAASEQPPPAEAAGPRSVSVTLAGARFHLELAADPATRFVGMGGRRHIAPESGMLFSFKRAQVLEFLMRDCLVPIDIAFLDPKGIVVAIHTMPIEPPRRRDEAPMAYESRLPLYGSNAPAQFVVETAGGRFAELGLRVGDAAEFDRAAVLRHTR